MQFDHLLVRYGELTLKGTNRKMFVNQLKDNAVSYTHLTLPTNREV